MHKQFFKQQQGKRDRRKFLSRKMLIEEFEKRYMLIGSDWSNGLSPLNVDNDDGGLISPIDVLQIINELNAKVIQDPETGLLPPISPSSPMPPPFIDVNCDRLVTPLDVLLVINHLNGVVVPVGPAFTTSGGTSGNFSPLGCGPSLREGTAFTTSLTTHLTIPDDAAAVSFVLEGIEFDASSQGAIRDAFEAALLDSSGRTLVHPLDPGKDSFFNSTENVGMQGTPQVAISGNRVTLSLADVLPGTEADLVFRLINNDTDTQTAAAIRSVEFLPTFAGVQRVQNTEARSGPSPGLPNDTFSDGSSLPPLTVAPALGAVPGRIPRAENSATSTVSQTNPLLAGEATGGTAIDSRGTEFWIGFPDNLFEGNNVPQKALYITGDVATTGVVEIPGLLDPSTNLPFRTEFAVNPGVITSVDLPSNDPNDNEQNQNDFDVEAELVAQAQHRGVHVLAQDPVTVYGINRAVNTTDAFLALPIHSLGTEYINLGYGNTHRLTVSPIGSQLLVVATEDNTQVEIVPGEYTFPASDSDARIYRPSGQQSSVSTNGTDIGPFTTTVAGQWSLEVKPPFEGYAGNYNFELIDVASAAQPVAIGDQVIVQFDDGRRAKAVSFDVIAGQQLYYDAINPSPQPNVRSILIAPSGLTRNLNLTGDDSSVQNQFGSFLFRETGTYFLLLEGNQDAAFEFGFRLIDLTTLPEIDFGTLYSPTFARRGQAALYQFDGQVGQQLYFDSQNANNAVNMRIYGPGGEIILSTQTTADAAFRLPATARYYIFLDSNSAFDAAADFRFVDLGSLPLLAQHASTSTSFSGGSSQLFRFQGQVGQKFALNIESATNAFRTQYELYDPAGNRVPLTSGAGMVSGSLLLGGDYILNIRGVAVGDSGDVTFNYSLTDAPSVVPSGFNSLETLTIAAGQQATFELTGAAGTPFLIDGLDTTDEDLSIDFRGPDGTRLFTGIFPASEQQDIPRAGPALLPESGTYTITLSGSTPTAAGSYTFRVLDLTNSSTPIQIGDTVSSILTGGREAFVYSFNGTAGQLLRFDGLGGSGGRLRIYDRFLQTTFAVGAFDATPTTDGLFRITRSGIHYVVLIGESNTPANIDLRILDVDAAPLLAFGERVTGTLVDGRSAADFRINLEAGQRIRFESLDSSSGSAQVRIEQAGGRILYTGAPSSDTGPRSYFGVQESGQYIVSILSSQEASVSYDFRIDNLDLAPQLAFDTEQNIVLNPGRETQIFKVSANAGDTLSVDNLTSTTNNLNWTFFGEDSESIGGENSGRDFSVTAIKTGTYYLLINGRNNTPLPVDFSVSRTPAVSTPITGVNEATNLQIGIHETGIHNFDVPVGRFLYLNVLDTEFAIPTQDVTLQRGETYLLQDQRGGLFQFNPDVTGSIITSDKPIAVFGGNRCTFVPTQFFACDHLIEQLPPTNTWGREFVTMPLVTGTTVGDRFRFLAQTDGTEVTIDGEVVATLNRGQFHEQVLTEPAHIQSSGPILVAQYAHSQSFYGQANGGDPSFLGDPFMVLIPPFEQFLSSYTVSTPAEDSIPEPERFDRNFINILVPSDIVGQVAIDDVAIAAGQFTSIGDSGFSGAQVSIELGSYQLDGPLPFGVFVYGFGSFDSYGYTGGQALSPVSEVGSVVLTPASARPLLNETLTLTARVADDAGAPIAGIRVDFDVAGVNPQKGFGFSDAAGIVQFSYVGSATGRDVVTASVGQLLDDSIVDWLADAAPPQITVTAPLDGSRVPAGTELVATGLATADFPNATLDLVLVNGQPVESIDAGGNFFVRLFVGPGDNEFEFEAVDSNGTTASAIVTIRGTQLDASAIDFTQFSDVSGSFAVRYARTSLNQNTQTLFTDTAVENLGSFPTDVPLLVGITNISDPMIQVRGADAVSPDGVPLYDFTGLVTGGTLDPRSLSGFLSASFYNPNQTQFTYDLLFLGKLNAAPEFTSLPTPQATVDREYSYQVAATDANAEPLSFSLSVAPDSMSIDAATGLVRWTPSAADVGVHSVEITVTDSRQASSTQRYMLTVRTPSANRAPVLTSLPVVVAEVGQAYPYQAVAVDADGDTLSFSLITAPAGMSINSANGQILWQPTASQIGDHQVEVVVADGQGGAGRHAFTVVVISPSDNLPPVIVNQLPTAAKIGSFVHQVRGLDADGETLTYQLLDGPAGMTLATDGTLSWNTTAANVGTHPVSLQVLDPRGGIARQNVVLAVFDNQDPIITSSPVTVATVGSPYSYQLTVDDAVDDMLSFKLLDAPPGMTVSSAAGLISWDVTDQAYESEVVRVQVTDGRGGVAIQQFTILVTGGKSLANNVNPFFVSMAPSLASVGSTLRYAAQARDPNADPLAYDLPLAPAGMVIDPVTGQLAWLPRSDQGGMQQVVIRAKDGTNSGIWLQSFQIQVDAANTAPVITSTPLSQAILGHPWQYRVQVQDADGDDLMFELLNPPAGMTVNRLTDADAAAVISYDPGALGSVAVTLRLSDGRGGLDEQLLQLQVVDTAANVAPVVNSSPRLTIGSGQAWVYVVEVDDPNADPIAINLTNAPAGMMLDDQQRILSWQPTLSQLGDHLVTLQYDDGQGGVTTESFVIEVTAVDVRQDPQIVSPPSAFRSTVGQPFAYDLEASDADGDPVEWTLVEAPSGASLDRRLGTLRWTPTLSQLGSQRFVVSAMDPSGREGLQSFSLLVSAGNLGPIILSDAPSEAVVDESYVYGLRAVDPENDQLAFNLAAGPAGMTIDSQRGIVRWRPTAAQLGSTTATVEVSDTNGNSAVQTFVINVTEVVRNQPPVITSRAVFRARIDAEYRYDVEAVDPEAETITFGLVEAPSGMQIDPVTGVITWTPNAAQAGAHLVRVSTADTAGNVSLQRFAVQARANQAPVITSQAPTSISVGATYRYDVQVEDPEDDPLTFELLVAPTGMSIDALGRILWPTSPGVAASNPIVISVRDAFGAEVMQSYTLDVLPDTVPPVVELQFSANPLALGGDSVLVVLASDDVGLESIALTRDGMPLVLDANNSVTLRGDVAGLFNLQASARDTSGNETVRDVAFRVFDPADTEGPNITITSPQPNAIVTTLTDIVGSITDDNLDFYRIDFGRADLVDVNQPEADDPDYKTLTTSNTAAVDEVLATFDPTMLHNDDYIIRILAQDLSGNTSARTLKLGLDGQLKLGQFELDFTDLTIPVAGIPITVTRSYDTRSADEQGDFGFGWTLSVSDPNIRETLPVNALEAQGLPRAATPFRDGTRVYLTNPEGRRIAFTFRPQRQFSLFGGGSFSAHFEPDPGVYDRLDVGELQLRQVNGAFYHGFDGAPFNPNAYRLTTKDGTIYAYGQFGGLDHIVDRNGNRLDIRPDGVFSSLGPSIQFIRDPQTRISQIIDPAGNPLTYTYDLNGNLASFADQVGLTTTYTYLGEPAQSLDTITDSRGIVVLEVEFDAEGRLISSTDALGGGVSQDYNFDNSLFYRTDANGNMTTVRYDDLGNITEQIDALGNSRLFEYDDPQNAYLETRIVDENGHGTLFTLDASGNLLTITDALTGSLTLTYNTSNNLTRVTDALGRTTTAIYDDLGNVLEVVNPAGGSITFAYDSHGRQMSETGLRGDATTFTYDETSLPTIVSFADGTTRSFEYNAFGQVVRFTDEIGKVSVFEYDVKGRPSHQLAPNSQESFFIYDGPLLVRQEERISETTVTVLQISHDDRGRIVSQTDGEGGVTKFEYDAAGNVTAIRDTIDSVTQFVFDKLNRPIKQIDSLGRSTLYEYDAVGNMTLLVNRNNEAREFVYDSNNRVIAENWIDATSNTVVHTITYVYDAVDNLIRAFDPDSVLTFNYDVLDRATSVDSLGTPSHPRLILNYEHDRAGNTVRVSDNLGVEVVSEFDSRNRLIARVWDGPAVVPVRIEFDYNGRGNRTEIRRFADANGIDQTGRTAFGYDESSRLVDIQHLNAFGTVLVDYDYVYDTRNRLIRESHHGDRIDYTYDLNGQLLSADHTQLPDEFYNYDANGNRIRSQRHSGDYVIGTNNQLLTDGEFIYEYDNEARLVLKTEIATSNITEYEYDHRGRLVSVIERSSGLIILSEVTFTYDVFDRRIVQSINGIFTTFTYDGDNSWADFDSAGNVISRYLHGEGLDDLLARHRPTEGTSWYLTDRLGSVRDLANADGTSIISHIEYDSYGNIRATSGSFYTERYAYTGREFDAATGLYYYRARYYDANVGRFITQDPISFNSGDANLYRYVINSPLNYVDPFGHAIIEKSDVELLGNVLGAVAVQTVCDLIGFPTDKIDAGVSTVAVFKLERGGFSDLVANLAGKIAKQARAPEALLKTLNKRRAKAFIKGGGLLPKPSLFAGKLVSGAFGGLIGCTVEKGAEILFEAFEVHVKEPVFPEFPQNLPPLPPILRSGTQLQST